MKGENQAEISKARSINLVWVANSLRTFSLMPADCPKAAKAAGKAGVGAEAGG